MANFKALFEVTEEHRCPFYVSGDIFELTDKAVSLPIGKPSCLVLVRELTSLLLTLLPHAVNNFAAGRDQDFTCGGCTGIITFRLTDKTPPSHDQDKEHLDCVMYGNIDAIYPAELLQVFHMHQKTGRLLLETPKGPGRVTFREGGVLAARFLDYDNQEAIFALLAEREGTFSFSPGLPEGLMKAREIGDFMMILMEGLKRLDEE